MKQMLSFLLPFIVFYGASVQAAVTEYEGTAQELYFDDNLIGIEIDTISFELTVAGEVTIDAETLGYDGQLVLLDSNGRISYETGSSERLFISETLEAGTYEIAIGPILFSEQERVTGYMAGFDYTLLQYPGVVGDWRITLTTPDVEVPLPAALPLFISALFGLLIARRRS